MNPMRPNKRTPHAPWPRNKIPRDQVLWDQLFRDHGGSFENPNFGAMNKVYKKFYAADHNGSRDFFIDNKQAPIVINKRSKKTRAQMILDFK